MKILLCSAYMPPSLVAEFRYASEAANNFVGRLARELQSENDVRMLSFYGFPDEGGWSPKNRMEVSKQNIHFVIRRRGIIGVLDFFRYQWKAFRLMREVDYVLLYNYYWINYAILLFARLWGIQTALIVADHSDTRSCVSLFRRFLAKWAERDYRNFDRLILLSYDLYKRFPHPQKLFFPGAIHMQDYAAFRYRNNKICRYLYSGLLNEVTGIDLYLSAIRKTSLQDAEFWFTGRGPLESMVREAAQNDERIVYKGFVSREDYYRILDEVDIVVNPRNMNLPENQNNFPSKIMEYLASGNIVVSTQFPGWEAFAPHILFCETSTEGLCQGLLQAFRHRKNGEQIFDQNRDFVQQYDWGSQTQRLISFLRS